MIRVSQVSGYCGVAVACTNSFKAHRAIYVPAKFAETRVFNLGDRIAESPRNFLGERDCNHRKINGRVYATGGVHVNSMDLVRKDGRTIIYCPDAYATEVTIGDSGSFSYDESYYHGNTVVSCTYNCYAFEDTVTVKLQVKLQVYELGQHVEDIEQTMSFTGDPYGNRSVQKRIAISAGRPFDFRIVVTRLYTNLGSVEYSWANANRQLTFAAADIASDMTYVSRSYGPGAKANVVTRAVTGLKVVDINSIAYARDAGNLLTDCKKLMKTVRSLKKPKEWANLWLSYRYGLRLFAMDTHEIINGYDKHAASLARDIRFSRARDVHETSGAHGVPIRSTICAKVYCRNTDIYLSNLANTLRYLDLYPSFSNIWDFVPYSFVIDWLVPVGDALARADAFRDILSMPILGALISEKYCASYPCSGGLSGQVELTSYSRTFVSNTDLLSTVSTLRGLDFLSGVFDIKHGIDALCLVSQRIK